MNRHRKLGYLFLALILVFAAAPPSATAQIQVLSSGNYGTPETISLAPSGFGAFGGQYFIPDGGFKDIWVVPTTGGPPSPFVTGVGGTGGVFLPSGWGAFSGNYLSISDAEVRVFNSSGVFVPFDAVNHSLFTTPLLAPPGFGVYGGHLFLSDQGGTNVGQSVWRSAPSGGSLQPFRDSTSILSLTVAPYGLEFAPADWGFTALLVSDGGPSVVDLDGNRSAYIVALDPSTPAGDRVFATVPLVGKDGLPFPELQDGLRQLFVTPPDYLVPSLGEDGRGSMLLVSIAGHRAVSPAIGEVLALNSLGEIKGHLIVNDAATKFNPRGMILTTDGHILVSDGADPIWKASPTDFAPGRGPVCSVISSLSTTTLWPPNHDLVSVGLAATSSCPASVSLAVYSDEDDTANTGDGNFSPDAKGTTPAALRLRAERNGNGDGRVYLVVVKSTDSAGTVASSCNTVVVPHSQSQKDKDAANAEAAAAKTYCRQHAGSAPPAFFVVGNGPVLGPKQ